MKILLHRRSQKIRLRYGETLTGPNAPDVIYVDQHNFPMLIEEGLVQPLDTFIQESKYNIEGIAPAVVEGIRDMGNGTLYALAPTFQAQALFYNKSFFDKMGVSYPTDNMSWDEIFNLARELSHEENGEKKYGFSAGWGDLYNTMMGMYAQQLGLQQFNEDFTQLTVNTPQWEKAWTSFIDLQKQDVIAPPFDYQKAEQSGQWKPYQEDDFISGRSAMQIRQFGDVRHIAEVMNRDMKFGDGYELEKFEWDIVTFPVHPENPEVGGPVYMNQMMAINATAQNPKTAWEYIAFLNDDRVAKTRANISWEMVSRIEYIKPPAGIEVNMEALRN